MDRRFIELVKDWKDKKGNLIPLLQHTQEIFGYLPEEAIKEIAKATGSSPAELYGVATFYAQFRFKPQGKHTIKVCHGTACHVNGADAIDVTIKSELGVDPGETTEDNLFSVEKVSCLGCCSLAPVAMMDDEIQGNLNSLKFIKAIRKIQNNENSGN